jgi:hypothetical protein
MRATTGRAMSDVRRGLLATNDDMSGRHVGFVMVS